MPIFFKKRETHAREFGKYLDDYQSMTLISKLGVTWSYWGEL